MQNKSQLIDNHTTGYTQLYSQLYITAVPTAVHG